MSAGISQYLKPSPFIERFARQLPRGEQHTILEIGCGTGRNGSYLSKLGHNVISFTNSFAEVKNITSFPESYGSGTFDLVVADARKPVFRDGVFSAVITNEVLHELSKADSRSVLKNAQDMTAPKGLNAVSGYFVGDLDFPGDKGQYLKTKELLREYDIAGWTVLDYQEDFPNGQEYGDKFLISSLAKIIARRDPL